MSLILGLRRRAAALAAFLMPRTTAHFCARRYIVSDRAMMDDAEKRQHSFEYLKTGRGMVMRNPASQRSDPQQPRCLIVPGFDGHYRQFLKLQRSLERNGIAVDFLALPGHLTSAKEPCAVVDIVETICKAHELHGPYDSTIAHCLSANATLYALSKRSLGQRLVFIAMPLDLERMIRNGGKQMGLKGSTLTRFLNTVNRHCAPFDSHFDWAQLARERSEPLLVLHANDDYVAPAADLSQLAELWPNCEMALFETGEHNGLLSQNVALERICKFLTASSTTAPNQPGSSVTNDDP